MDTLPVGIAVDLTSNENIPWGEGSLPPMPRLLLYSNEGLLCVFNIINLVATAPQICNPPTKEAQDSLFTSAAISPAP